MKSETFKIISLYILICLIWGSTWLAIRIGLESLTPLISSGIRFVAASAMILVLMKFRGAGIQKDKAAIMLYLMMIFFSYAVPFGLVYWGEQYVPSGLAAVLFAVYPFVLVILSYFFLPDEEIGILKFSGLVFGFGGIVVIFSDQFGGDMTSYFWGMIAVVASGVMQSGIAVAIKKYGHHLNPLSMNFVPMLFSGILLLSAGLLFEDLSDLKFDSNAVFSVAYLALFGSVITFTSYYWLLKRVNIILLSLVAFITPVIALILGWVFSDEVLMSHHLIGSALVLFGLLIANSAGLLKRKKTQKVL